MVLSGRRPLLSLYLDPRSALAPGGELLPFWSRFLVAFTRTAERLQHVVAVDVSDDPANALNAPAQGFVIATTTGDAGLNPADIAFGQLLVGPGSRDAQGEAGGEGSQWSSRLVLDFHHDAAAIARDVVAALAGAGVRELLVVGRPGEHEYVSRIIEHLRQAAPAAGLDVSTVEGARLSAPLDSAVEARGAARGDQPISVPDDERVRAGGGPGLPIHFPGDAGVDPQAVAEWVAGRPSAGVLAFGQVPAVRSGIALAGRDVTASASDGVVLMLATEVPVPRTDAAMFVSLEGVAAGRIVAESVVRALATGEVGSVVLPHAVVL